ncbi:MAG: metallophosphoesterase [Saprospiraceae bacterium]|nr:metallophosphoesterase [Saprospiraceae bacterium]MBK8670546.1 metallophosphoesterase [Saprospiraceae bacterium]
MKICLITDLHIDSVGESPLSVDTRNNFVSVLEKVKETPFDLLILAGDLCHKKGDQAIYNWIYQSLPAGIPCNVIAGNHDDAVIMASVFNLQSSLEGTELFYSVVSDGTRLIFLDTSSGMMSDVQFQWLKNQIERSGDEVYIFMHHPPLISYSYHMEPKYSFQQMEKFETLCQNFPDKVFNIFTGHYHIERFVSKSNMRVFITPSTFVQIDPNQTDFRPYNTLIGYREINILDSDCFYTNVIYC